MGDLAVAFLSLLISTQSAQPPDPPPPPPKPRHHIIDPAIFTNVVDGKVDDLLTEEEEDAQYLLECQNGVQPWFNGLDYGWMMEMRIK